MGRVFVVGSLTVELVTHVERVPTSGETVRGDGLVRLAAGRGANQAVAALEAGADVVMIGTVGDDDAGRAYADRLRHLGIEPLLGVDKTSPTGHALVTVDDDGGRTTVTIPGSNTEIATAATDAIDAAGPGDVVLIQLEIPVWLAAGFARQAGSRGARVVVNCAPYAALPPDVVALADPLVVNQADMAQLADSEMMPESLVVTFGAAGAVWGLDRVDAVVVAPDLVVDPTGAGDAFCGALVAAVAAGADRTEALQRGVEAGARAVQRVGAQPNPTL